MKRTGIRSMMALLAIALVTAVLAALDGCGSSRSSPHSTASDPPSVGRVTDKHSSGVTVTGKDSVGAGTDIDSGDTVTTDHTGLVDYVLDQGLSCKQDIDTAVVAKPDDATELKINGGNAVVCDTPGGATGPKVITTDTAKISMAEPVLSVAFTNGTTVVRVADGQVTVASPDGGNPVTLTAGQQVQVAGGQPPTAPVQFRPQDLSDFERSAFDEMLGRPTGEQTTVTRTVPGPTSTTTTTTTVTTTTTTTVTGSSAASPPPPR